MYKLDLADPRLVLPVPIYQLSDSPDHFGARPRLARDRKPRPVAFFAPDRSSQGSVPVYEWNENNARVLKLDAPPRARDGKEASPLFYALSADTKSGPATATPLYEFVHNESGARAYSTEGAIPGYRRTPKPLCLVWRSPIRVVLP